MTEPTAEQVEAERELARAALHEVRFSHHIIGDRVTDSVAASLARVRIEAHAAGRRSALDEAADEIAYCPTVRRCADAIRALRGRT